MKIPPFVVSPFVHSPKSGSGRSLRPDSLPRADGLRPEKRQVYNQVLNICMEWLKLQIIKQEQRQIDNTILKIYTE